MKNETFYFSKYWKNKGFRGQNLSQVPGIHFWSCGEFQNFLEGEPPPPNLRLIGGALGDAEVDEDELLPRWVEPPARDKEHIREQPLGCKCVDATAWLQVRGRNRMAASERTQPLGCE